ncbi:HAT family dimerization protein, partial [Rhizoctonia solani AG-3 Rhs1AP]
MDAVIRFFEECARSPKLDSSASHLTELKIGQLTDLVYARITLLPKDPTTSVKKRRRSSNKHRHKSIRKPRAPGSKADIANSSSDSDFIPRSPSTGSESGEILSESEIKSSEENTSDHPKSPDQLRRAKKQQRTADLVSGVKDIQDSKPPVNVTMQSIECTEKKRGRDPVVRGWAFAHHERPIESFYPNTDKPAWAYKCKYCPSVHHFPRTHKDISKEKISATNLAGHLKSYSNRHAEILTTAQKSLGEMFKSAKPSPALVAVTPLVFRSTLIQGVVLNAQNSRFAITSDAWTSKSFVYSLGGVVVTFIDKSWNLQEFVLDIVHLDADHTGTGMGRRIFGSLDWLNAAGKVIASVTDNASNNRTLNAELSARLSRKYGYRLNVDLMSVTCLCHALHLVSGAIFSNLKAMDPLDDDDAEQYSIIKSFEEGEIFEESAEVLEEEERLKGEEKDSDTYMEWADVSDEEWDEDGVGNYPIGSVNSTSRPSQTELNCVQKVHCIVVDITSSAARRKRMRMITWALGLEPRAVIKSVKVRWNSILAEICRAILLKPAINQYVATLDEGKTGVALCRVRALKKKLAIVDEEWDALNELTTILGPIEAAARDYSKRGRTVLHSALPTYIVLREKLIESRVRLSTSPLSIKLAETLVEAIKAGEEKLNKYLNIAAKSDLTILASIFHPGMRLSYFQDAHRWGALGEILIKRGQELIEYLYEVYNNDSDSESSQIHPAPRSHTDTTPSGWIDGLLELRRESSDSGFPEEVQNYLDGKYRYKGGDILVWWKENESHIPVLSQIARDILAIPATSVSVECLFSQCKLVMSDYRNMSVDTARQIITCQQAISKKGFAT